MSSIAGVFYLDGRHAEAEALASMTEPVLRGPLAQEGAGPATFWTEGPAGLAHRLRRFTPEDAFETQPLHGADGRLVLVADARLDNREELGRTFGIPPGALQRMPDSALILKAYEKWGRAFPEHLLGAFGFALWDRAEQRLVLGRDHFGRRSLFYYQSARVVAFASSLTGLLRLREVPRRLNEPKVADYLLRMTVDPDETFFADVRRLPLAHTMTVEARRTERRRYRALDPKREVRFQRDEDYAEALRDVFTEAVRCRLRSAYPVGSHLSGGLDSSSVTCVAAGLLRERGERLTAFSAVPPEGFVNPFETRAEADERPYIDAVLARYGNIDGVQVITGEESFLANLYEGFDAAGAPLSNVQNRVWAEAIQEEAARRGVRVLLTGQGGNITVSWHGRLLFPEMFWRGQWGRLGRMLRVSAVAQERSVGELFRKQVIVPTLPGAVRRWGASSLRGRTDVLLKRAYINPEFARRIRLVERVQRSSFRNPWRVELPNSRRRRVEFFAAGPIQDGADLLAAWRDGYGVELRDPTLDKRVVELCLAIPSEQYIAYQGKAHAGERMLLRRAMANTLPPLVAGRTTRGVQAANWFQAFDRVYDTLWRAVERFEASPTARSLLDLPRMQRHLACWSACDLSDRATHGQYGSVLSMGITAGHFLLWFERQMQAVALR